MTQDLEAIILMYINATEKQSVRMDILLILDIFCKNAILAELQ